MKYALLCLLLLTSACQHKQGPQNIDLPQLKSYLTQQNVTAAWSSKARTQALGGRVPTSSPAPTFGMPFSEAKLKARLLDVRPEEDFAHFNLGMEPTTKIPVVNIPAPLLIDPVSKEEGLRRLESRGFTKDSIVIVICNKGMRSPVVAEKLSEWGYPRVLNYGGGYSELRACGETGKP